MQRYSVSLLVAFWFCLSYPILATATVCSLATRCFLLSVFQYLPTVTSQSTMKRLVKTALLLAAAPYLAKKNSKAIVPYLFFSFLNIVHTAPRKWWLLSSFLISIFLHKLSTSWKKEKRLVATSATADQVPRKHSNPHTQTHTQAHTHTHTLGLLHKVDLTGNILFYCFFFPRLVKIVFLTHLHPRSIHLSRCIEEEVLDRHSAIIYPRMTRWSNQRHANRYWLAIWIIDIIVGQFFLATKVPFRSLDPFWR